MTANQLKEKLEQLGVSHAAVLPVKQIPFDRELRGMCEANRCGAYGKNWMCPPYCGEIDELIAHAKSYKTAVVFQNIYHISDSFDIEGMQEASGNHRDLTRRIYADKSLTPEGSLMLGAGGCNYCKRCAAADDKPCPFPDKAFASLEAYGIYVSQLAEAAGLKYINGQNTITYFSAILLKDE
ncbi:MAG: DUF2284 domain-containing protein [Oscillospiraceae bacterium]